MSLVGGCFQISVAPTCPEELALGESGQVDANQRTPGEIATYLWTVSPALAGTFAEPTASSTTFEALAGGNVIIRITASDGLFVAVGECRTRVELPAPQVSLANEPTTVVVGDQVVLACSDQGETPSASFEIEQSDGETVGLTSASDSTASFTAGTAGDVTFTCVGVAADGSRSEPSSLTVSVTEVPDDTDDTGDGDDRPSSRG